MYILLTANVMKNIKKESKEEGTLKNNPKAPGSNDTDEIKTDFPLSEKDEVKQAETRMRKAANDRK